MQPVLSYKQKLEDGLQIELAQLKEAYIREVETLRHLAASKEDCARQLRSFQTESMLDLELIHWTMNFLDGLHNQIEQQTNTVAEAQARMEDKRQLLVKATQERKALEKLRERFLVELAEEERLQESRTNDEIGTALHHLAVRESSMDEERAAS